MKVAKTISFASSFSSFGSWLKATRLPLASDDHRRGSEASRTHFDREGRIPLLRIV